MTACWSRLAVVAALAGWAGTACAQSEAPGGALNRPPLASALPTPAPGEEPVCGVHFYGPCLPADAAGAAAAVLPKRTEPPAPAADRLARTAFDEVAFAGDDPLVKTFLFAEASGEGPAGILAASGDAGGRDSLAALSPRRFDDPEDGREPVLDPGTLDAGTRMDPVQTGPRREPEGSTLVKVVAPRSATARLNWMSIRSAGGRGHARNEAAFNHAAGLWDAAPWRGVRSDLEDLARTRNYIRPTVEADPDEP